MTPANREQTLAASAKPILDRLWQRVLSGPLDAAARLPCVVVGAIDASIESRTKSFRYVLPTQLLAKLTDGKIDCRAVQRNADTSGAFDARSFCRATIVQFDRANHNVLGGSGDPYVSNPLRIAMLSYDLLGPTRDTAGLARLITVLEYAQQRPDQIETALVGCLLAVRRRLDRVHITYPAPSRISLADTLSALNRFLEARTGGRRLQSVCVGLLRTIGDRFALFAEATSGHVNAADVRTGHVADITCTDDDGNVVLAVEVKDRQLELREVHGKLDSIRERGITELLYLMRGGVTPADREAFAQIQEHQFRSGHSIYACEFDDFLRVTLILLGESGRRDLLLAVGAAIDEYGDLSDRESWRDRLAEL